MKKRSASVGIYFCLGVLVCLFRTANAAEHRGGCRPISRSDSFSLPGIRWLDRRLARRKYQGRNEKNTTRLLTDPVLKELLGAAGNRYLPPEKH